MRLSRRELFRRTAQTTVLGVAVLSLAQNAQETTGYGSSMAGASSGIWDIPKGCVSPRLEKDGVVNHVIYSDDGWIPLDGRSLSREKYPMLYNAIGTTYGGRGKGFRIPDVRPRKIGALK